MDFISKDIKYIWHPYTQMKDYETDKMIFIERGEGIYLFDDKGNQYIDGISSWWVNIHGHCNERLNNAIKKQLDKLEHVIFAGFTHQPAVELAEKLIEISPTPLSKVFYSDNGSTAVEVALKMAYQYWQQSGVPEKTKFVALENAYHGDTLGSVAVGGVDLFHSLYKPLLFDIHQVASPYCYRCPLNKTPTSCNIECIQFVEEVFEKHSNEIAGIIVEPLVQAAGGYIIYPPEYLSKLRSLCDRYDVLLIDDEVAMGFGRTGKMFACNHAAISPDLMCLSKGLTGGYLPLAVTLTTDKIYEAFYDDYEKTKTFYHGHSYTGNPISCSVAIESIRLMQEQNMPDSLQSKIRHFHNQLKTLSNMEYVGDIRSIGMVGAIELVKDKTTKEAVPPDLRINRIISQKAFELGAIIRPLGNIVYLLPPLIITEKQIDELIEITKVAVDFACKKINLH